MGMCDRCVELNYETDEPVAVSCSCSCEEEDQEPLDNGDTVCDDCKHRVKG
jgi:hypothetical protein